eukprot:1900443-Lingulodinium_polyedra.AAC.1
MEALRRDICRAAEFSGSFTALSGSLSPTIIGAYEHASGDPDSDLVPWLVHGAPLGVLHPVTPRGVFPPVDEGEPASREELNALAVVPDGWANYQSAEEEPTVTADILEKM